MYNVIFDYYISDTVTVMIKASCKDVDKYATDLKIELPKGFIPTRDVSDDIEIKAIEQLRHEKMAILVNLT